MVSVVSVVLVVLVVWWLGRCCLRENAEMHYATVPNAAALSAENTINNNIRGKGQLCLHSCAFTNAHQFLDDE